jgi:RNA polymerase primary sigma factor
MKLFRISNKITSREISSFKQYLKEVNEIPMLTPQEEAILAVKAVNGDQKATDELVEKNLRFVISVAKQYATDKIPLEDLVNEGNLGLIYSVSKFTPDKGYKFISFAVWWVRKFILEHISKHGKTVRLPANKINNLSKLDKFVAELEQKNCHRVDVQQIIDEYSDKLQGEDIMLLDALNNFTIDSLDREIGTDEGNALTMGDFITAIGDKETDYLLNDVDVKSEIDICLDNLKPRNKQIMQMLFGLNGYSPMTLQEVGDYFKLTREMVRQVREKSLVKMRKNSRIKTAFENFG